MKKSISLILVLIISALSFPLLQIAVMGAESYPIDEVELYYSGTCGENAVWKYNSYTKEMHISGTGAMKYPPELYYESWSYHKETATSIRIDEGITSIGNNCFNEFTKVKTVELPSTLTEIGAGAFYRCSVMYLTIPDSVTRIGANAFNHCFCLSRVTLPDSLSYLGADAFSNCGSLQYVNYENGCYLGSTGNPYMFFAKPADTATAAFEIADGAKFVADKAFADNSVVIDVTVPDSVISIGSSAFSGCVSLKNVKLPANLSDISKSMFENCTAIEEIQIPGTVKSIGNSAFKGCTSLTFVTVPDSVEKIESLAFYGCTELTEVNIGKSLSYMGSDNPVFGQCPNLRSFNISEENTFVSYENGFLICSNDLVACVYDLLSEDLVIPSGVKKIGGYMFSDLSFIKSLSLPEGLEEIGRSAFRECTGLTSVTFSEGLKIIAPYAFYHCVGLSELYFPDSLYAIKQYAFADCESLKSVRTGESLTIIENRAFSNCRRLFEVIDDSASINLQNAQNTTDYGEIAKYAIVYKNGAANLIDINGCHFKKNKNGTYSLIAYVGFDKAPVLPEAVEGKSYDIGIRAFADNEYIETLVIPDAVTAIGRYAFENSKNLSHVSIGKGIKYLGNYEFVYSYVKTVDISSSIEEIYPTAFIDCVLTQINFMGTRAQWYFVEIDWDDFNRRDNLIAYECCPLAYAKIVYYCTENGHTEAKRTAKEATCTEDGTIEVYCSVCDEVISTERIPKGHSYEKGVCTVCGA
ncbi:MAG: leucine-rich repeat domain-containing protein, partial [Clostridia bacterium]|nr:leucine-rich repeat domain-containing protein [Clostridia bacterium]